MDVRISDRERAEQRLNAKLGWSLHAGCCLLAALLLAVIDIRLTPGVTWWVWPAAAWAVLVALHGAEVFALATGTPLRERLLARELECLPDTLEQDTDHGCA